MNIKRNRRQAITTLGAISLAVMIAPYAQAQKLPGAKPLCESERGVSGWSVTASLSPAEGGDLLVSTWEASRNFNSDFGLRVTYDTSENPEPRLSVWHNYKSGDFTLRLRDGRPVTVHVGSNYAVTVINAPPEVMSMLRDAPVQIEFTTAGGKWTKYMTEGLPEAIAAAEEDLSLLKDKQDAKECVTLQSWWRRF